MCGVIKSVQESWNTTPRRVKFWLLGGVFPTFITLAIAVFCDMWVGYTVLQALSNHFLDFCLAIFTLAVSIFSAALDYGRKINKNKRTAVIAKSVSLGLLCAFLFLSLYFRKLLIERQIGDLTPPYLLMIARIAIVFIAFFVIQTGIFLEKETNSPSA